MPTKYFDTADERQQRLATIRQVQEAKAASEAAARARREVELGAPLPEIMNDFAESLGGEPLYGKGLNWSVGGVRVSKRDDNHLQIECNDKPGSGSAAVDLGRVINQQTGAEVTVYQSFDYRQTREGGWMQSSRPIQNFNRRSKSN